MHTRRIIFLWIAIGTALIGGLSQVAHAAGTPARSERLLAASELNTRDPEIIKRAFQHPKVDAARALSGDVLIRTLRQGGYVLYMRHTQTGMITPACTVSNLSPAGERDAKFMGGALRQLRIPIDRILSSPVCRVVDTARLLGLGEFETSLDLSNVPPSDTFDLVAARKARIAESPRRANANTLLVGHMHAGGANESDWMRLDFGEIIVYQPDARGASEARARIRVDDWYDLIALEKK